MINISLNKILFFDIEVVSQSQDLNGLEERLKNLWVKRAEKSKDDEVDHEDYYEDQAAFYAEFSRVICITCGFFNGETFRVKSICGDSEIAILKKFQEILDHFKGKEMFLCGHNIKEFDTPFLCKRYVINGIEIPAQLNHAGKKPWDIKDIDLMELWKFGSFKGKLISLDLLSCVLGIESPKTVMDGGEVRVYFYQQKHEDIARYCADDVITTARIMQKLMRLDPVKIENIDYKLELLTDRENLMLKAVDGVEVLNAAPATDIEL